MSQRTNVVDTVDLDSSFQSSHLDLRRLQVETLCTTGITLRCTTNSASPAVQEHGTHTAGIIGADWNNGTAIAGRSLGVSGANPTGNLHGVPLTFNPAVKSTGVDDVSIFGLVLDNVESGTLRNVRVINWSYGINVPAAADWWKLYPRSNCGPGPADDGQPGSTLLCTPNNQDDWLAQAAASGAVARTIAKRAGTLNVLIVEAAGNDGDTFCSSRAVGTTCPAGWVPINAAVTAPFSWAARNWTAGDPGMPLVVAAVGDTSSGAAGAGLQRASFSNIAGDVAAPGVNIVSTLPTTAPGGTYGPLSGTSMSAPFATALIGYLMAFDRRSPLMRPVTE